MQARLNRGMSHGRHRRGAKHTPWWVFLIFLFVMSRGVAALQTRTVEISRLAILPVIFAIWGGYSLFNLFGLIPKRSAFSRFALLVGAVVGLVLSRHGTVRADQTKVWFEVSGSPVTSDSRARSYSPANMRWAIGPRPIRARAIRIGFLAADTIVSGLVIGIFVGRFAGLWRRYKAAPASALAASALIRA